MQHVTINMSALSSSQCWDALHNESNSFLIDVRSKEEWLEFGIADLSSINKEVKLVSWVLFKPYIHQNIQFIDELNAAVADKNAKLFFICKSGSRSSSAAKEAIQDGYKNCYNVNDGFMGNIFDENSNSIPLNGWINSNLPRKML